jgi:hypothetical protein
VRGLGKRLIGLGGIAALCASAREEATTAAIASPA